MHGNLNLVNLFTSEVIILLDKTERDLGWQIIDIVIFPDKIIYMKQKIVPEVDYKQDISRIQKSETLLIIRPVEKNTE